MPIRRFHWKIPSSGFMIVGIGWIVGRKKSIKKRSGRWLAGMEFWLLIGEFIRSDV
jgi:hypothetical protein